MEIFDIVDETGRPTGQTVSRTQAHAEGIRHRTAHIWIVKKEAGRCYVLLQKRAMDKDSFPGCFDTSSSGHIQAGDEPLESALRELQEELGIVAEEADLKPAGTFDIRYEKEFYGKMFRDREVAYVFLYSKPVDIAALTLQKEEVDGVQWFSVEEVAAALNPRDARFCVPAEGFAIAKRWCEENL